MIIMIPLSALLVCPLGIIFFEVLYASLSGRVLSIGKHTLCAIWWLVLSAMSVFSGWLAFMLSLPAYALAGITHCRLAASQNGIITVLGVFNSIPDTVRVLRKRIRPYLK